MWHCEFLLLAPLGPRNTMKLTGDLVRLSAGHYVAPTCVPTCAAVTCSADTTEYNGQQFPMQNRTGVSQSTTCSMADTTSPASCAQTCCAPRMWCYIGMASGLYPVHPVPEATVGELTCIPMCRVHADEPGQRRRQ
jgi:hypothetical protein